MKPTHILFIGNSFTNRNDVPGVLAHLAEAAKPTRTVTSSRVIANGMSLKTHWSQGQAREAIDGNAWDYVVLQEQSTLPLKNRKKMHESIRLFDDKIKSNGAKTVLYLTWARQKVFEKQDELTDAYVSIGRELNATIVPAGIAWQYVISRHPHIVLHDKDGSHPNLSGSYLAACAFFTRLFQQNPVGLPGVAGLEADVIPILQEAAWVCRNATTAVA